MILGGDEICRTQFGNNNAYCQDNEISWVDWTLDQAQRDMYDTTRWLLYLRHHFPALRPDDFGKGQALNGDSIPDVSWWTAEGERMPDHGWGEQHNRVFQLMRSGQHWGGDDALIVINGTLEPRTVQFPVGHRRDGVSPSTRRGRHLLMVVSTSMLWTGTPLLSSRCSRAIRQASS